MKKIFIYIFFGSLVFLPNILKRLVYNKILGWEVHETAKIGLSFLHAKKVKIGAYSTIGHFNVIRNLELFEVGKHVCFGNLNSASAMTLGSKQHFQAEEGRVQALIIGDYSGIVKKHYFDCNNTITIGHHTILAGMGSSFFTHSINIKDNRQETARIHISNYCMVGAHSVVTRGAILPERSVLAANSTLHKSYNEQHTLYSGVPAIPVKKLDPDSKFFHRKIGFVD